MGKTFLLTGHPQSGKTTIIRKVVDELGDLAGGFYTEEIFGAGGRKGFFLITLEGQKAILAHKDIQASPTCRIGRYGVDPRIGNPRCGCAAAGPEDEESRGHRRDRENGAAFPALPRDRDASILGPASSWAPSLQPHPHADLFKTLAQVNLREVTCDTRQSAPRASGEIHKTLQL